MTDQVRHLRRERRALRRRLVREAIVGVVVLGVAIAAVIWLVRGRPPGTTPPAPPVETAAAPRVAAAPPAAASRRAPLRSPDPAEREATPAQVPLPAPIAAALPTWQHRAGDFLISIERAVVTRQVLTRFFGIPATHPDPALVLEIRVANPDTARTVHYRTLRGSGDDAKPGAVVVDDAGRLYPAIEYGAIPRGGISAAPLEPGAWIGDVLSFRAVPPEVGHLDLIVRAASVGAAADITIRLPAGLLEFEAEPTATRTPEAAPRPSARARQDAERFTTTNHGLDPAEVRAHERLLDKGNAGDVSGQLAGGRNFQTGEGTVPNAFRAMSYYTMAAEQGDPEGQWRLGRCYRDGIGLAPEPKTALRWFLKAAMQDHAPAQWDAARMLRDGDGVRQNLHQAKRWLGALVKSGDREAHLELVELDPARYMKVAARLRLRNAGPFNEPGSAVRVEGRLGEPDGEGWTLVLENGRSARVKLGQVMNPRLKQGILVEAYGILGADATIEALHAVVPEARCVVTRNLALSPQGIVPYRRTRYIAEITVHNSGVQPIVAAHLTARMRVMSAVSQSQTATLPNLAPGTTRLIRLEFSVLNPSTVSPPVCDILALDLDW